MIFWMWLIPAFAAGFLIGDYVRWAMMRAEVLGFLAWVMRRG